VNKRELGTFYEDAASEYLQRKGIMILERNFRCRMGEIDIIGKENDCVVFFEVKYRKSGEYGQAIAAVDYKKQKRISKCASFYCMQHPQIKCIRYDVIGITDTNIEWVKNAFPHRGYGFY